MLPGLNGTCPGCTVGKEGCAYVAPGRKLPVCYVNKIMTGFPSVKKLLEHNTEELDTDNQYKITELLDAEFKRFYAAEKRAGYVDDDGRCRNHYRIHWAGDIPNLVYARALAAAMEANPNINFWCYTRSFDYLTVFRNVPNLVMYISADPVNLKEAEKAYIENSKVYTDAKLAWCYMSREKPEDQVLVECPVDSGKMALEGACHKCRLCLKGHPVWFKIK